MRALFKFPLHYQIFLALALGTLLGLVVNPGAVRLDDIRVTIEATDDRVVLTELDESGRVVFRETFESEERFQQRYKDAAELYLEQEDREQVTAPVTDRRVHFSEDLKGITVRYSREYDGQQVVNSPTVPNGERLEERFPTFVDEYEDYAGSLSRNVTVAAKFLGDTFLRLLMMITIPLIVTSLISGITGLGGTARLGSMFGKTLLYYVTTSMLAIITGITLVNILKPGIGAELPGGGEGIVAGEAQTLGGIFAGLVENMIPPNPIAALANGDFLAIIVFSILVGVFIIKVGGTSGERLREFFQAGFDIMMGMTMFIIRLAPIGVFAFMLYATASQGLDIFRTFALYMLTVFLALVIHACVVLPLVLLLVARRSPLKFAQAMSPALLTAFSTASSNGTLPLTITSVEERAGISNRVSSFVLPLGATINMDGTALYEAVAVLFIAQAYNGFVMPVEQQIVVALTALLASVGAAGIPSAGLVMMAIVLQAVGLPLDAQGLIIAVDRVLDMARTSVNVWSDSCGCAVIARFEEGSS